jgi:hypothetical protein
MRIWSTAGQQARRAARAPAQREEGEGQRRRERGRGAGKGEREGRGEERSQARTQRPQMRRACGQVLGSGRPITPPISRCGGGRDQVNHRSIWGQRAQARIRAKSSKNLQKSLQRGPSALRMKMAHTALQPSVRREYKKYRKEGEGNTPTHTHTHTHTRTATQQGADKKTSHPPTTCMRGRYRQVYQAKGSRVRGAKKYDTPSRRSDPEGQRTAGLTNPRCAKAPEHSDQPPEARNREIQGSETKRGNRHT